MPEIKDVLINPHPRFATLAKNVRERKGSKFDMQIPLFLDDKTDKNFEKYDQYLNPYPGMIYMDAPAFGNGNCALQVTISPKNIFNSRFLYDQLSTICPIMVKVL